MSEHHFCYVALCRNPGKPRGQYSELGVYCDQHWLERKPAPYKTVAADETTLTVRELAAAIDVAHEKLQCTGTYSAVYKDWAEHLRKLLEEQARRAQQREVSRE